MGLSGHALLPPATLPDWRAAKQNRCINLYETNGGDSGAQGDVMSRILIILVLLSPLSGCATAALTTLATGVVVGAAGVAIATGGVGNPF